MSPGRFLDCRHELGLTQEALAAKLKSDVQAIARYEKGQSRVPGPVSTLMEMLIAAHREQQGNVVKIKRKARPLTKTYQPDAPYVVTREDEDDGSIRYVIFDERPESYRFVCATYDEGGTDGNARRDADLIARGLNLLVQYGLEKL